MYGQTPGYAPILVVASIGERPIAKLQAVICQSTRYLLPSIKRCEVFGIGEYFDSDIKVTIQDIGGTDYPTFAKIRDRNASCRIPVSGLKAWRKDVGIEFKDKPCRLDKE